jgi:hypothetical protein
VLPDQGLYEERYRLTGAVAASLAVTAAMLAIAVQGVHESDYLVALAVLIFVTLTVPGLAAVVTRKVAFRADPMGLTLGGDPLIWAGRGSGAVFIPWCDVEKIVIYRAGTGRLGVGVQRYPGAPPLPLGNEPSRRCPVPGIAEGATRQAVSWRLDRERLTSLVAAVAPGIPVIDTEGAPVEGSGQNGADGPAIASGEDGTDGPATGSGEEVVAGS